MRPPRFSLVIPAFNEERFLPCLLDSVDEARRAYSRGPEAVEVIVADNCSTDRTALLAAGRGCQVVRVEKRVIGAVRNGGARAARGEMLCFVDADARIHPRTFDVIERSLETGKVVGGATGVRLERWSAGLAVIYAILVPMAWLSGMDTGVVFCRRQDFDAVGGYDETRLYAEDLVFLLALRRLGKARGQQLARLTSAKALASTRKFDEFGDWHYLTDMPKLGLRALRSPAAVSEFAQRYWYHPKR